MSPSSHSLSGPFLIRASDGIDHGRTERGVARRKALGLASAALREHRALSVTVRDAGGHIVYSRVVD